MVVWEIFQTFKAVIRKRCAQSHRATSFSASQTASIERPKRDIREAFMKFFTTSPMGLGIATGAGKRDSKVQSNFRAQSLEDYQSVDPATGFIWCPILHEFIIEYSMTAAHIFSYKHGQSAMDSIFGKKTPAELFSRNGLMICSAVEKYFDAGVMAIVSDLPERPTTQVLYGWLNREVRDFKVRIIDTEWGLDRPVYMFSGIKWRELDNRKLSTSSRIVVFSLL